MNKRTRDWRRLQEVRVKNRRMSLAKSLGLQQGLLYDKHREKICYSAGYIRDGGNIRHFVACKPRIYPYKRNTKYKEI